MTVNEPSEEELGLESSQAKNVDVDLAFYEAAVRDIAHGDSYICMICTVEMDYTCSMYACTNCYRVFDYDCVREWAVKSAKRTTDGGWKCPNCLHVSHKVPAKDKARCWCGKTLRPDPNPMDPNSCGQTCNARICRHGCSKVCHLGPHEECMRTTTLKCRCGKHKKDIFCYQTQGSKRVRSFRCEDECGKLLPCGRHKCKKKCHAGSCGYCPETLKSEESGLLLKCYCGNKQKISMRCKDVRAAKKRSKNGKGETWTGYFSCNKRRSVKYSCLQHEFIENCKIGPTFDGMLSCPYSPKSLKTCPCGKNALKDMSRPRKACTDPIPTCNSKCGKPLSCGKHRCPFKCHEGSCMDPCLQTNVSSCSCQRKKFITPCKFENEPKCNIKCESLMSCRRHRCIERCCSGRASAEVRKKTPYSSSELQDESLVEAEHICVKDCNLKLSCGIHSCPRKCHPGKCPPCLESDSNDLSCPCGKTVVEAPVRCGTKLPPCEYPCIKVVKGIYECGHKPMPHSCHPLDQPCPPCTAPVLKVCKCGEKENVRTICFQTDVSCGQKCNKALHPCRHTCQKTCHMPGDCQKKCKQTCNRLKIYCDHKCSRPCHGNEKCPDSLCTALVKVKCACGVREDEVVCGASSKTTSALFREKMSCDANCEIQKRRLELKEAFGICEQVDSPSSTEASSFDKIISSANNFDELLLPYTEVTMIVYSKHVAWCASIEKVILGFINDSGKKSLYFKPMKQPQRNFIHELVKAYKLYSESQDREPMRSVYVKKKEGMVYIKPLLSLEESLPLYQSFRQLEKKRKAEMFESQLSTKLINFNSKEAPKVELATYNGFLITNIVNGTTEADLERIYATHLKPTLIKNPQFKIIENVKKGLIFPEDYSNVNVNVERDLEGLVGHFDHICVNSFIGDSVRLCQVDAEFANDN